jgi:hypothetical protein
VRLEGFGWEGGRGREGRGGRTAIKHVVAPPLGHALRVAH